jgi:hypothetical protein
VAGRLGDAAVLLLDDAVACGAVERAAVPPVRGVVTAAALFVGRGVDRVPDGVDACGRAALLFVAGGGAADRVGLVVALVEGLVGGVEGAGALVRVGAGGAIRGWPPEPNRNPTTVPGAGS